MSLEKKALLLAWVILILGLVAAGFGLFIAAVTPTEGFLGGILFTVGVLGIIIGIRSILD